MPRSNRANTPLPLPPGKARVPLPGGKVRGSTTGRPLMAALDLLGRRWSLRVLWELRRGPVGARELRSRCGEMSSSVLYSRLDELRATGLVEQDPEGAYTLTPRGRQLAAALEPLQDWARRWADDLERTNPSADVRRPRRSTGTSED
jgi:DNA-binding HxlR family transcriptional regulator